MKGDFTRDTYDQLKHFTRVLMQQGRVQLDADWNEQGAILVHYLRALAKDLIGPHGGTDPSGFKIDQRKDDQGTSIKWDFTIGAGNYYVKGLLCENKPSTIYTDQEDHPLHEGKDEVQSIVPSGDGIRLVYLDVWERHITYLEDGITGNPNICEVALGVTGPDTATRAKLVQQVKVSQKDPTLPDNEDIKDQADKWVEEHLMALSKAKLRARAHVDRLSTDPCAISPEARYRGAENQLYRVEVHRGGKLADSPPPTFKWSRENGSVVFPISKIEDNVVTLKNMGRDNRFGLTIGDWVEIVDDDYVLQNRYDPLAKVKGIDPINLQVTLERLAPTVPITEDQGKHPLLRRWDHKAGDRGQGGLELSDGAALIVEGDKEEGWLTLEDGVQIQFQNPEPGTKAEPGAQAKNWYRTGDYWLIPARTATGDVEWPGPTDDPRAVEPHGVRHYYAPLALIHIAANGDITIGPNDDLRRPFEPLGKKG